MHQALSVARNLKALFESAAKRRARERSIYSDVKERLYPYGARIGRGMPKRMRRAEKSHESPKDVMQRSAATKHLASDV